MKYLFAATVPLLLAGCSLLQSMNGTPVNETLPLSVWYHKTDGDSEQ